MLKKESEQLELKKSTSELKEAVISIASMLNKHQRGELFFGIKNNGEIHDQSVTENTLREISKAIADYIEPKIFPKIKAVVLGGKKCVHIEFTGNNVPYYAYGRAYMRVGDEDGQLSAKELERLILQKNQGKMRWDEEMCVKAKLTDINTKRVQWFLKKSGRRYHGLENSLEKLGLLQEEKLRNAAAILFGKKPQQFFPNAKLVKGR